MVIAVALQDGDVGVSPLFDCNASVYDLHFGKVSVSTFVSQYVCP